MKRRTTLQTAVLLGIVASAGVSRAADAPQTTPPPGKATAADNTASNAADRNEPAATPMDQSNAKSAVGITAHIRHAVVSDSSLSTSAHNVKIITRGDTIILRGPVDNAAEKDRIESLAQQYAAGRQVRDEISIKHP